MAQRSIWEGHLRLSLVACPLSPYLATGTAGDIHFPPINPKTWHRVRMQAVDPQPARKPAKAKRRPEVQKPAPQKRTAAR
jgi:non-homologous end joining protein Ku